MHPLGEPAPTIRHGPICRCYKYWSARQHGENFLPSDSSSRERIAATSAAAGTDQASAPTERASARPHVAFGFAPLVGLRWKYENQEIPGDYVEILYVCAAERNSMMGDNPMQQLDDAIAVPEAALPSEPEAPTEGH